MLHRNLARLYLHSHGVQTKAFVLYGHNTRFGLYTVNNIYARYIQDIYQCKLVQQIMP
jgi:hypothetical protein